MSPKKTVNFQDIEKRYKNDTEPDDDADIQENEKVNEIDPSTIKFPLYSFQSKNQQKAFHGNGYISLYPARFSSNKTSKTCDLNLGDSLQTLFTTFFELKNDDKFEIHTRSGTSKQSFLECIGLYLKTETIQQQIKNAMTLNNFSRYHHGQLISEFSKTHHAKKNEITQSFAAFQEGLTSMDHTYLWDVISDKNKTLFPQGLNIFLIEYSEIMRKHHQPTFAIVRATNSCSNFSKWDPLKPIAIILKTDDGYFPIHLHQSRPNKPARIYTLFHVPKSKSTSQICTLNRCTIPISQSWIQLFLEEDVKTWKVSATQIYKESMSAMDLYDTCQTNKLKIEALITFHVGEPMVQILVGFHILVETTPVFVPCCFYSMKLFVKEKNMPTSMKVLDYVKDKSIILQTYSKTLVKLKQISRITKRIIPCNPVANVVESHNNVTVVGILTESNQIHFISPQSPLPLTPIDTTLPTVVLCNSQTNTGGSSSVDESTPIQIEQMYYVAFENMLMTNLPNLFQENKLFASFFEKPKFINKYFESMRYVISVLRSWVNKHKWIDFFEGKNKVDKPTFLKNITLQIPKQNMIQHEILNEYLYFSKFADNLLRNPDMHKMKTKHD